MIYDSVIWKIELQKKTEEFIKLIADTDFSYDWYVDEEEDGCHAIYYYSYKLPLAANL